MNVLIIRNAFRNDFGGAETYAFNLANALHDQGEKVLIISRLKPLLTKCRTSGIRAKRGPWNELQEWTRTYYIRYLLTTLWYCLQIIIYRADVVNPQGRDDFVFATNAAWLLRKPVIWTDHGDLKYILAREGHWRSRIQSWVLAAARKASVIICVSESEKREIEAVAPELSNLIVVHNGVFEPVDVKPVKPPKGSGLVIGTNARLVKAKGIMELLEGFARSSVGIESSLWIIGSEDADREEFYNRARQLSIDKRVTFFGYVTNPNDYIAAMDIFVHASYHEAFSLAVIEAAMLGRPIIATAVGGTPEIIDASCGILIQPRSSKEICVAINKLGRDMDLRLRLGTAAKTKALASFNFATIFQSQLLPIYKGEE